MGLDIVKRCKLLAALAPNRNLVDADLNSGWRHLETVLHWAAR